MTMSIASLGKYHNITKYWYVANLQSTSLILANSSQFTLDCTLYVEVYSAD